MTGDEDRRHWFARKFAFGLPPAALPDVIERLRGTPGWVEERVRDVPADELVRRVGDAWSIQENVGHLLDLEPLWAGRLDDLLAGEAVLRPADLTNRGTHEAGHNARPLAGLLTAFRAARARTVERLEGLGPDDVHRTARHPRLDQPMSVMDLFFFVAEHDDHHLSRMTQLRRGGGASGS